jgi:hypothetical protein
VLSTFALTQPSLNVSYPPQNPSPYQGGRLIYLKSNHNHLQHFNCSLHVFYKVVKLPDTLEAGPGGLSVAQGLTRIRRTCALFPDSKFRNDGIYASHNILTRDGTHPAEFRKLAREQI